MKRIIKEFKEALTTKKGTSAYDTTAEVIRVDGSTLWVHIPGGVDETPVRKTVDAKEGDTIQVRVGGGSAWATGNASAPPTDDSTAKVAKETADVAKNKAGKAQIIADSAWKKADFALVSANGKNTVYYSASEPTAPETGFKVGDTWFDTANDYQINEWDGSDWVPFQLGEDAIADLAITNAKIANATIQSAKIAGLDVGKLTGGYIDAGHINTLELVVGSDKTLGDTFDEYDGAFEDIDTEMSDMADDIDAVESTANTALSEANQVYPYMTYINSTYGVRVYRGDKSNADNQKYYSQMNAGGFDVVANDVTLAHLGFNTGQNQSGSTSSSKYPYYTFGKRLSDTPLTRGNYSVAEGNNTIASGWGAHAEGNYTTASGKYGAHAEGNYTEAIGDFSHAQNTNTVAGYNTQTVIGAYNDNDPLSLFEIGNGDSDHRSNALSVDWDGNVNAAGAFFSNGAEFSKHASNHVVIGGYDVCWGRVSISHTGEGYKEVQVTLPCAYESAPYCFASFGNRPTGGAARTAYATQSDLAGNKIYVGSYATGSVTAYVNWMTIGV